ncbi:hypothetical protein [Leptotrichia trevisanii]|uniref:hypothetical protein n=1 Tax=Leptotrichia trevisanii TaxID=109328 RepID=UPI0026EDC55A|nr:hypothetical protein [Leptotrichia trevisanii]
MKKILMLFLLAASLGFSANYKVEVKPNVKIQQTEIEQNNLEIEKVFNDFVKDYLNNELKNLKNEDKKSSNPIEKIGILAEQRIIENIKFSINKIEYISSTKAKLTFVLEVPDYDIGKFNSEDLLKIEKILKAKTGKTLKEIEGLPEEEVQKYYFSTMEIIEEFFFSKNR